MEQDLLVICPTRERPEQCARMIKSFEDKTSKKVQLIFVIDKDDIYHKDYLHIFRHGNYLSITREHTSLAKTYNNLATKLCKNFDYYSITCDDYIYHTGDWDRILISKLEENGGGFAYGDDMYGGKVLPTTCIISANIIKALGYIVLPSLKYLYGDQVWKQLGERTKSLFYVPEVKIEHITPLARKCEADETHKRTNAVEVYRDDQAAFRFWLSMEMDKDVDKIKTIL